MRRHVRIDAPLQRLEPSAVAKMIQVRSEERVQPRVCSRRKDGIASGTGVGWEFVRCRALPFSVRIKCESETAQQSCRKLLQRAKTLHELLALRPQKRVHARYEPGVDRRRRRQLDESRQLLVWDRLVVHLIEQGLVDAVRCCRLRQRCFGQPVLREGATREAQERALGELHEGDARFRARRAAFLGQDDVGLTDCVGVCRRFRGAVAQNAAVHERDRGRAIV